MKKTLLILLLLTTPVEAVDLSDPLLEGGLFLINTSPVYDKDGNPFIVDIFLKCETPQSTNIESVASGYMRKTFTDDTHKLEVSVPTSIVFNFDQDVPVQKCSLKIQGHTQ